MNQGWLTFHWPFSDKRNIFFVILTIVQFCRAIGIHCKANILNDFIQRQTLLDDQNAVLPDLPPSVTYTQLSHTVLTLLEVESILKTLTIGTVSGPNELSNGILRALSCDLSSSFCLIFNHSLRMGIALSSYKEANVSQGPKKGDRSLVTNYRPVSLLNSEAKYLTG